MQKKSDRPAHYLTTNMRKNKELDEYLEILWHLQEKQGANFQNFFQDINKNWDQTIIKELIDKDFIEVAKTSIKLSKKGSEHARRLIRSHRLAERLLTDVLNMELDHAETGACEFEHVVVPEIADGICTLLGHPKVCPHGLPIPEGQCCREARRSAATATKNLTELKVGEQARVAYLNTQSNTRMHQLTQMGIHPGSKIWIHQKYPALIIRINSAQIALDENVAKDILVWEQ